MPFEIYDLPYDRDWIDNLIAHKADYLAGALGFKRTSKLWRLRFKDRSTEPVIQRWLDNIEKLEGEIEESTGSPRPFTIDSVDLKFTMELGFDPNVQHLIKASMRPTLDCEGVTEENFYVIALLWHTRLLMLSKPSLFLEWKLQGRQSLKPRVLFGLELLLFFYDKRELKRGERDIDAVRPVIHDLPVTGITDDVAETWTDLDILDETLDSRARMLRQVSNANIKAMRSRLLSNIVRPAMSSEERKQIVKALLKDPEDHLKKYITYEPRDRSVPDTIVERRIDIAKVAAMDAGAESQVDPDTEKLKGELTYDGNLDVEEHREKVKRASADAPSLEDACRMLGLNSTRPAIRPENGPETVLKGWQVRAIAWMLAQEKGNFRSGILADACGLGKTLTLLSFLYISSKGHSAPPYRPTLIVVPAGSIETWFSEIRARFKHGLKLKIFYDSKGKAPHAKKSFTVDNNKFREWLTGLDSNDEKTGRTIVLTSYLTWVERCIESVDGEGKTDDNADKPAEDINKSEKQNNACEQHVAETEASEPKLRHKSGLELTGRFARVVCDKGHIIRNVNTKTNRCITGLKCPHTWILTPTPMINKPLDLRGLLMAIYDPSWEDTDASGTDTNLLAEYEKADKTNSLPLRLLSPVNLDKLDQAGQLDSRIWYEVILRNICLARDHEDLVDPSTDPQTRIRDDIPNISIWTTELRYSDNLREEHDTEYFKCQSKKGENTQRDLCLLAICPRLYKFVREKKTSDSKLEDELDRQDLGFSLFFKTTRKDPVLLPALRPAMAYYIGSESPKLRYMLRIFKQEGMFNDSRPVDQAAPRFIVFCRRNIVLWFLQLFLDSLSIPYQTLKAKNRTCKYHPSVAAANFNNPSFDCQVLLTTFSCEWANLNLHSACSRAIIFEPAANYNSLIHAIGRIHRLGQTEKQKVWILFMNHTSDRWNEYKYLTQAYFQMPFPRGNGGRSTQTVPRNNQVNGQPTTKPPGGARRNSTSLTQEQLEEANEFVMEQLGQTCSRLTMGNNEDLGRYDEDGVDNKTEDVSEDDSEVDDDDDDDDDEDADGTKVNEENNNQHRSQQAKKQQKRKLIILTFYYALRIFLVFSCPKCGLFGGMECITGIIWSGSAEVRAMS
ncbi:uncharacterized protein DSM5745_01706 [Aspergillus mulundensis]|uniref:Helicase ATP-binding domain-containing protein n=1 Tax=Aspergillus mulundensis TaxID=1810919 RepID=A0A3D8SUS3_9EURO|nr:hypothetical protein DSM5745_01706 [Aspergillus mulundensis]RDW89931.1 hypothetical protein DSM5745_01706 [Aspergillus mulundensis]